jgi:tetratricopeptide (TPR) repeat protein
MHIRCALAVLVLGAGLAAQSPPPCPADRPVDDLIAEVHRQQAKSKHRNANPFPEVTCIWGWCRDLSRTPPPTTEPPPPAEVPDGANGSSVPDTSSSKTPEERCNSRMHLALEAAHHVEVGDYYFQEKNYRAARLRYQEAVEWKPDDAALHVRMGRVLERLSQPSQALEHYATAEKLALPGPWLQEARAAVKRLQPSAR